MTASGSDGPHGAEPVAPGGADPGPAPLRGTRSLEPGRAPPATQHSSGAGSLSSLQPGGNFANPISADVAQWLSVFQRTAKALRVYDRGNAMITQFAERLAPALLRVFEHVPELTLVVREDRLQLEKDDVLVNADRQDGLPFVLYRNAFRRITFERGMSIDEQLALLGAIAADTGQGEAIHEDLLSALWRLQLPHLRYFTIDAMSIAGKKVEEEDEETQRLQAQVDDLVVRLYAQRRSEEVDVVRGASIAGEDLQALKELGALDDPDQDESLDVLTARAIAMITPEMWGGAKGDLDTESLQTLLERFAHGLLDVMLVETGAASVQQLLELIQQVVDSLILSQDFGALRRYLGRLTQIEHGDDLQAVHFSRHLRRLLATEARVSSLVGAFNNLGPTGDHEPLVAILRALGQSVVPAVLSGLDGLSTAHHRKALVDLVLDLGLPDPQGLHDRIARAQGFVVLELLALAQRLDQRDLAPILLWAVAHPSPKVRAQALGMLRNFPHGAADELILAALDDTDDQVRVTGLRLVAARRLQSAQRKIEQTLKAEDVWDKDARELRGLTMAYVTLARDQAVPLLERLLSPGLFPRPRMTPGQLAAASALGRLGSVAARSALTRGGRTLNPKVRDAVRRALAREGDSAATHEFDPAEAPATGSHRLSDLDVSAQLTRGIDDDPLDAARRRRDGPSRSSAGYDGVVFSRDSSGAGDRVPERSMSVPARGRRIDTLEQEPASGEEMQVEHSRSHERRSRGADSSDPGRPRESVSTGPIPVPPPVAPAPPPVAPMPPPAAPEPPPEARGWDSQPSWRSAQNPAPPPVYPPHGYSPPPGPPPGYGPAYPAPQAYGPPGGYPPPPQGYGPPPGYPPLPAHGSHESVPSPPFGTPMSAGYGHPAAFAAQPGYPVGYPPAPGYGGYPHPPSLASDLDLPVPAPPLPPQWYAPSYDPRSSGGAPPPGWPPAPPLQENPWSAQNPSSQPDFDPWAQQRAAMQHSQPSFDPWAPAPGHVPTPPMGVPMPSFAPPQGYGPPGYAPPGYPPPGYPPGGYAPPGYPPGGYAPPGYPPGGYVPGGYAPSEAPPASPQDPPPWNPGGKPPDGSSR